MRKRFELLVPGISYETCPFLYQYIQRLHGYWSAVQVISRRQPNEQQYKYWSDPDDMTCPILCENE